MWNAREHGRVNISNVSRTHNLLPSESSSGLLPICTNLTVIHTLIRFKPRGASLTPTQKYRSHQQVPQPANNSIF